ncbi:MAG: hypothetical protein IIC86_05100 [Chloroflexi bacterium]|nr:hypothetical protein [Chloroflexota bacterium]
MIDPAELPSARLGVAIAVALPAAFVAGYVIVVDHGATEAIAISTAACLLLVAAYVAVIRTPFRVACLTGLFLGGMAGAAFALGVSTPHVVEIGDRTRDTWTEVGWQGAVMFLVFVFGGIGAVAGTLLGAAIVTARNLWRFLNSPRNASGATSSLSR